MSASEYQYWLGKEKEDLKWVGKRGLIRLDADDKATGKAEFGRDIKLPGMLYAKVLMCPYAAARIKSMDTSAAEVLPGVRAVLRYDDPEVPKRVFQSWDPDVTSHVTTHSYSTPIFILGQTGHFEGEPMGVAIAADSMDIAEEAMDLVQIEWEVKDFVIDPVKALEPGAPHVYDYMTSYDPKNMYQGRYPMSASLEDEIFEMEGAWEGKENATNVKQIITGTMTGSNMEAGFAEADNILEFAFERTENRAFSPEIPNTTARWVDDGTLELWFPYQDGAHKILGVYSAMLGLPTSKFRINTPYCGGSFGGWSIYMFPQHTMIPIAALLAKKANAPIKIMFKRHDTAFAEMDQGIYNVKVGYKNDGTITAVETDGTFAQQADIGSMCPDTFGIGHLLTASKVPNLTGRSTTAFLNKHGFSAHRCEQQIADKYKEMVYARVAAALEVDVPTIALKNEGKKGNDWSYVEDFRERNKMPNVFSMSLCIDAAKGAVNWDEKFHAPGKKVLSDGKLHGLHISPKHEFSNGGTFAPYLRTRSKIHVSYDFGKVYISAHKGDVGTDARTAYSRVVAEEMGLNFEDVIYSHASESSDSKPHSYLSGGGGSIVTTGNCWQFVGVARGLKEKMLAVASGALGVDAATLDIVDSNFVSKGDPSKILAPVVSLSYPLGGLACTLQEIDTPDYMPPAPTPAGWYQGRSANTVEVAVDPETGGVEILNAIAVNDVGLAIGPETVEGQMYGGAIMGYSTGGIEEVVYDPNTGIRLNPNFIDYKILTMADIPNISTVMIESRMGNGPYGSAGVGEDNCTFCSSMIIPAIYNATGVWVDTYPPTPERVLKALGKA